MKKTVFAAAALLATAAVSSAQAQSVRLGLRAGANYSNLAGNVKNQDTYNNKIGFLGGVMLNVPVTDDGFFSVQPEILYSQKGFENKPTQYTGLLGGKQTREGQVNRMPCPPASPPYPIPSWAWGRWGAFFRLFRPTRMRPGWCWPATCHS